MTFMPLISVFNRPQVVNLLDLDKITVKLGNMLRRCEPATIRF